MKTIIYQEVKLFGKSKDGFYLGQIEEIATGNERKIFGVVVFPKQPERLFIKNRMPFAWILSIFTGYRQIGIFKVNKPHNFNEQDLVIVKMKNNKIIRVTKPVGNKQ